MTQSDKVNRQKSVESGLSQAMVPMIFCGTEKSISVKPKVSTLFLDYVFAPRSFLQHKVL